MNYPAADDALLTIVRQAWGWTGMAPRAIIDRNAFGNLLLEAGEGDADGPYWRICPEELSCRIVAADREALDALLADAEHCYDWNMAEFVAAAQDKLGTLREGYSYSLKLPVLLGGEYIADNIGTVPVAELLSFSGAVARKLFEE
jgi:hypothetical protein